MPSALCRKWEEKFICFKWGAEKVRGLDRMQNLHKTAVTEMKGLVRDPDNDRLHGMSALALICTKEWHLWLFQAASAVGFKKAH